MQEWCQQNYCQASFHGSACQPDKGSKPNPEKMETSAKKKLMMVAFEVEV